MRSASWTPHEWLVTPDGSAVYLPACVRASAPPSEICAENDRLHLAVFDHYFSAGWTTLRAYDAGSYAALAGPRERPGYASCGAVTQATAPGVPRDLRASVSGSMVHLSWTNIGAASNFVVDVGYDPGRTDLSVALGADPQAVFTGVPPGRYYVRVRGGNFHGGGRPSPEAVVVVR